MADVQSFLTGTVSMCRSCRPRRTALVRELVLRVCDVLSYGSRLVRRDESASRRPRLLDRSKPTLPLHANPMTTSFQETRGPLVFTNVLAM